MNRLSAIYFTADGRLGVLSASEEGQFAEQILASVDDACSEIEADLVLDWIAEHGACEGRVPLLLPSSEFLCVSVDDPELARLDRKSLMYAIEPRLPVDVESIEVDCARTPTGQLMVGIESGRWIDFVQTLERGGMELSIFPTALCLAGELSRRSEKPSGSFVFVWDEQLEYVQLASKRIVEWRTSRIGDSIDPSLILISGLQYSHDTVLQTAWLPVPLQNILHESGFTLDPLDAVDPVHVLAESVASKRSSIAGEFDFRSGRLAPMNGWSKLRRPVSLLATSVVLLLVGIHVALAWKGARMQQVVEENETATQSLYRQSFADRRVPASLVRHLRSERAQLRRDQAVDIDVGDLTSALNSLVILIDSIPEETRVLISRISCRPDSIDLEGFVNQPRDWLPIAEGLRSQGVLLAAPEERTDEQGTTWFRLAGQLPAAEVNDEE